MDVQESRADRKLSPKKRGSKIGFINDPFRKRSIWYESLLEQSLLYQLIVHPETEWVAEQQEAIFFDRKRKRRHFFDFRRKLRSGKIVAYAVKYEQDVNADLRRDLQLAEAHNGSAFADDYRILTEKHVTSLQVRNAAYVVACGNDYDVDGQRAVEQALARCPAETTLDEVARAAGLPCFRGRRAAATLVQKGLLAVLAGESIRDSALVNRVAKSG